MIGHERGVEHPVAGDVAAAESLRDEQRIPADLTGPAPVVSGKGRVAVGIFAHPLQRVGVGDQPRRSIDQDPLIVGYRVVH